MMLKSVYPRWRGEHFTDTFGRTDERGLFPLARGTQSPLQEQGLRSRFIPAGAGNTRTTPF